MYQTPVGGEPIYKSGAVYNLQDFLVPAGVSTSFTFDKSKFQPAASHASCLTVTISSVECRDKGGTVVASQMTATMDSSGGSFTVTPSSTYDFVAAPLLCKVIFNVNPTLSTATFIDSNGAHIGPAT